MVSWMFVVLFTGEQSGEFQLLSGMVDVFLEHPRSLTER
jgi:hypothetical protein